jgi:hypothetical protein
MNTFCDLVKQHDFTEIYDIRVVDINHAYDTFITGIQSAYEIAFPMKKNYETNSLSENLG